MQSLFSKVRVRFDNTDAIVPVNVRNYVSISENASHMHR